MFNNIGVSTLEAMRPQLAKAALPSRGNHWRGAKNNWKFLRNEVFRVILTIAISFQIGRHLGRAKGYDDREVRCCGDRGKDLKITPHSPQAVFGQPI